MSSIPDQVHRELKAAGLRVIRTIVSVDEKQALLCRHLKPPPREYWQNDCIWQVAIVCGDRVCELWPDQPDLPLQLCTNSPLWNGTYLLVGSKLKVDVLCFDMKTGKRERNLLESYRDRVLDIGEPMAEITGVDVDPTGRYALVAWQWDDFPGFLVFDSDGDEYELDANDLIDASIYSVRWCGGTEKIACQSSSADGWITLPVDLQRRVIEWKPEPILPPADDGLRASAVEILPSVTSKSDEDPDPRALPEDLANRYRKKGYSDDQIAGLAVLALIVMRKGRTPANIRRLHQQFLRTAWLVRLTAWLLFATAITLSLRGGPQTVAWICILCGFALSFWGRKIRRSHAVRDMIAGDPDERTRK